MATATSARIGANVARIDGRLKVTGGANYGDDMTVANPAGRSSTIARLKRRRFLDWHYNPTLKTQT